MQISFFLQDLDKGRSLPSHPLAVSNIPKPFRSQALQASSRRLRSSARLMRHVAAPRALSGGSDEDRTHFGFQDVRAADKQGRGERELRLSAFSEVLRARQPNNQGL